MADAIIDIVDNFILEKDELFFENECPDLMLTEDVEFIDCSQESTGIFWITFLLFNVIDNLKIVK